MQQRIATLIVSITTIFLFPQFSSAHFGMIIPSDSMVMQNDMRTINLQISFSHPFEGIGMPMDKPDVCNVMANGVETDLLKQIYHGSIMDQMGWFLDYTISRPGVYMFYVKPKPYWEPSEDAFIIHYTKTVVTAFGDDEGWDREIGLKAEIIPLSKPYGLYAGNIFQGIVSFDGRPLPYSEVEVEYYNQDHQMKAPSNYMITQTIKTDGNGIFSYAAPLAGWWGFAALKQADFTLKHNGEDKTVEIGAVIWIKFHRVEFN